MDKKIKFKANCIQNLPIIPNELKEKVDRNSLNRTILFEKDVIKYGYKTTGVYQDLDEKIVSKCEHIMYSFIKNCNLSEDELMHNAYYLAYNPNKEIKNKLLKLFKDHKKIVHNVLNSFPEDFNILNHVKYNKNENVVEYTEYIIKKVKGILYETIEAYALANIDEVSVKYISTLDLLNYPNISSDVRKNELIRRSKEEGISILEQINNYYVGNIVLTELSDIITEELNSINLSAISGDLIAKLSSLGYKISYSHNLSEILRSDSFNLQEHNMHKIRNLCRGAVKGIAENLSSFFEEKCEVYSFNLVYSRFLFYFRNRNIAIEYDRDFLFNSETEFQLLL